LSYEQISFNHCLTNNIVGINIKLYMTKKSNIISAVEQLFLISLMGYILFFNIIWNKNQE